MEDIYNVAPDFADVFAECDEDWVRDACGTADQFLELASLLIDHLIQCPNHDYHPGDEAKAIQVMTYGLAMAAEETRRLAAGEMGLLDELQLMGAVEGVTDD